MALNTVILSVYAEYHLCYVVNKPIMLCVVMLNVVMLSVVAPFLGANALAYLSPLSVARNNKVL
jgi:hypothetical protein